MPPFDFPESSKFRDSPCPPSGGDVTPPPTANWKKTSRHICKRSARNFYGEWICECGECVDDGVERKRLTKQAASEAIARVLIDAREREAVCDVTRRIVEALGFGS